MDIIDEQKRVAGRRRKRRSTSTGRSERALVPVFLVCALVFGGAGISSPLATAVIVLLGLAVLAQRLPRIAWSGLDAASRIAAWLVLATGTLCLVQVVPLPRGIWAAMPGHGLAAQIAATVGAGGWTAWSLSPDRTLEALTAFVPATAAIVVAAQASSKQRRVMLQLVLGFALISAALAVVQIAAGPNSAPVLFATRHRGFGVGLFVNRNHMALFLLLAMLIAALPGVPLFSRKPQNPKAVEWGLRTAALALLAFGVLATLSRTGVFLTPVALVSAIVLSQRNRVKVPRLLGGVAAAGVLALFLRSTEPVQTLLARYATAAEDKRFDYWANTWDALRDALPLGTGFGTFTQVYPTYEPLVEVEADLVNHAHNDLFELILEAGLPGAALLVAWIGFVIFAAVRARRTATSRRERLLPLAVGIAVFLALAASVVDYPLRMLTISVTFGLLIGMLLPQPETLAVKNDAGEVKRSRSRWLVAIPLSLIGLLTISAEGGRQLVMWGNEPAGAAIAPFSSTVQSVLAHHYEMIGQPEQSSRAARSTLALSPLDAVALRSEGMAGLALGRSDQGAALMSLGARLGWRDTITQLWLIEQSLSAQQPGFAVQRIDGLLRQGKLGDQLLPFLPGLMRSEPGRVALAEQLSFNPGWRVAFFNAVARDRSWTMPQLLDVAARLRRAKAPISAADTALIRAVLADQGRFADTLRLWQASGQSALIGDGKFEDTKGELPLGAAPFAWLAPKLPGVRLQAAEPEISSAGKAMSIASEGVGQGVALAQTIVLAPGRYELSLSALIKDAPLARGSRVTLGCRYDATGTHGDPIAVQLVWRGAAGGWQHARGIFVVPANCPGQVVQFLIPSSGGRPYSLWLDDVSIRSVP